MTYLGHDDSGRFYDIGSWALSIDNHILVLKGGREGSLMFRLVDTNTLRKRNYSRSQAEAV
jgi:hypothetical protein